MLQPVLEGALVDAAIVILLGLDLCILRGGQAGRTERDAQKDGSCARKVHICPDARSRPMIRRLRQI